MSSFHIISIIASSLTLPNYIEEKLQRLQNCAAQWAMKCCDNHYNFRNVALICFTYIYIHLPCSMFILHLCEMCNGTCILIQALRTCGQLPFSGQEKLCFRFLCQFQFRFWFLCFHSFHFLFFIFILSAHSLYSILFHFILLVERNLIKWFFMRAYISRVCACLCVHINFRML